MFDQYILVNGKIKKANSFLDYALWFEDMNNRRIDRTEINEDVYVSTVFLGIDHNFGRIIEEKKSQWHVGAFNAQECEKTFNGRKPILFETMVFGGEYDQYCWRYSSMGEAKIGHWNVVDCIRNGIKPDADLSDRPWMEIFLEMFRDDDTKNLG